jgi:hypothetical protein
VRTAPASGRRGRRQGAAGRSPSPAHVTSYTLPHRGAPHKSNLLDGMHAVLEIKELLSLIMAHLREDHLSTLVPLTRTCRELSEPALDLIWAEAPLYHLACTMPKTVWTRTYRRCPVQDAVDEGHGEGSDVSDDEKEDLWTIVRKLMLIVCSL